MIISSYYYIIPYSILLFIIFIWHYNPIISLYYSVILLLYNQIGVLGPSMVFGGCPLDLLSQ